MLHLLGHCHRPEIYAFNHWVANNCLLSNFVEESVTELGVPALLDDKALSIETCLCVAIHSTLVRDIDCSVHVRSLEHNKRIIASQFKSAFLQVLSAHLSDLSASIRATRKLDSSQARVLNHLLCLLVVNEDIREFRGIEPRLVKRVFEDFSALRRRRRVLLNDRVADHHASKR